MQIGLGIGIPFKRNAILAAFNPANLFNAGEQGVWYDPSDFDRYTAPLGPELVANGDFTSAAGWVINSIGTGTVTISGGVATLVGTDALNRGSLFRTVSCVIGRSYKVTAVISGAQLNLALGSTSGLETTGGAGVSSSGLITFTVVASAQTMYIKAWSVSTGGTATIDNISVRELTAIDTATLFQDSAGTTPVTAVEQPVGLMLDKSKGLALGAGLVTNGDFSNGATGWSAFTFPVNDGSIVVSGGVATITTGPSTLGYAQQLSLVVGKMYRLSGLVEFVSGSGASIAITNAARNTFVVQSALVTTVGQPVRREIVFTATETNPWVYMRAGNNTSVGKFSDIQVRELPGNHAFQTTSTSRPVLSARYNLLTKTEQFDDAVWSSISAGNTISANTTETTDPLGGNTADKYNATATTSYRAQSVSVSVATHTLRCYVKRGNTDWVFSGWNQAGTDFGAYFNLASATVGTNVGAVTAEILSVGNGWYFLSVTKAVSTAGAISVNTPIPRQADNGTSANGLNCYVWGIDLRVTNDAAGQPAYQRVNTATDYDTTGFKPYLRFDGTDDWLQTNSINFTVTDKMTVFAGVRKLSDAARGVLAELSASTAGNAGSFVLTAPEGATSNYGFGSRGSILNSPVAASPFPAPITNVLTGVGNISGDSVILRVNGAQAASDTSDQGTGNYGNHPLYIGRRGGATLPFNGRLYGLIVRGAATDSYTIESIENYMGNKVGSVAPAIQGVPTIGVIL